MSISELCLGVGKFTCCRRQVGIERCAVIVVAILAPLGSVNAKLYSCMLHRVGCCKWFWVRSLRTICLCIRAQASSKCVRYVEILCG